MTQRSKRTGPKPPVPTQAGWRELEGRRAGKVAGTGQPELAGKQVPGQPWGKFPGERRGLQEPRENFTAGAAMAHLQGILTLLVETSAPGLQVGEQRGGGEAPAATARGTPHREPAAAVAPRLSSPAPLAPPRPGRGETQPLRQLGAEPLRPLASPRGRGFRPAAPALTRLGTPRAGCTRS